MFAVITAHDNWGSWRRKASTVAVVAASHPAGLKIAACVFISYLFVVQVLFLNVEEEPAQKQQYYFSKPQTRGPGQNRAVKKRQRTDTR